MPSETPLHVVLRELRAERGLSLRQAARDLGVDPGHLSRVERGKKPPSKAFTSRAADYYAVERSLFDDGDVPGDVLQILRAHPELIDELRAAYGRD